MSTDAWPALRVDEWADTRDTLHLWTQVVGKVRLALEPPLNHWWQVPLYVTGRGLSTSLVHAPATAFDVELDFVDHVLHVRAVDGRRAEVELRPRSVADFHAAFVDALGGLGVRVDMLARPVELPEAIPFAEDEVHRSYDAGAANRFWRQLVQADRLLDVFRARFAGKASPVHFFWGAFDLAATRFSGRSAPKHPGGVPNCADWVMHEAYSHEVSSAGFWPGGSDEGSFYAYAYPEPPGYADWEVPSGATYDAALGEHLLPWAAVREAEDPDALVLAFLQSTFDAAATLGRWDEA